ncbi:3-deoxy-manno-octulosonate cytidylyltransferase [Parvularcula sp. IMCC14364]|uniref:3-deoxy-manno-octulosonate cytidylyltransferase n=1 Tax=Parvularcula sp. IMCC14364 TaxID=3067902 RepID=UPI0027425881|nr:3-deoxy-manno-octulosonate cytidylyltransferase [Parvularcula sp. IMCC14364]
MRAVIIIPARYASSRLPGKPLLAETGKPLIQHTYEQAAASKADEVIVATDDERIATAVQAFGGRVAMTSADHESGTARVAEAARDLEADIIVNMQGDEPETEPDSLNHLIDVHERALSVAEPAFVSTLVCPFSPEPVTGPGSPEDPSCVKAVLSGEQNGYRRALYFSRALVPFPRDDNGRISDPTAYYLHLGVYAFSMDSLQAFSSLPASALEHTEKLEQLRILEAGHKVAAGVISSAPPGVDTPEDYAAFVRRQQQASEGH